MRSNEIPRQHFHEDSTTPLRSGRSSFQKFGENISPSVHLSSGGSNIALIDALRESTLAEPAQTRKQHKDGAASFGYPMSRQPSVQVSLPRDEVLSMCGGNTGAGPALPMGSFKSSVRSSSQYIRQYPTNQIWSPPEPRGTNARSPRSDMSSKTSFRVTNNGSGFDGAMDDRAESTALMSPNRSPSAKSKSPAKGSPSKVSAITGASPSSPSKKSPVKAKLQNLADRAKGGSKKDKQVKEDPSTMNPEE
ncbi:hypothetical protein LTS18_008451 [Coniosporium uncinatum]|uniref:Uncharacterized protein n=1 Tax=Coniosporium uncinatum TaxID=93489 RepID=A0ACC3DNM3_9PEZI|nr:hypothetical protein LTS18_008451 [Coniosporium uncinatum]